MTAPTKKNTPAMKIDQFLVKDIKGNDMRLGAAMKRVTLIVNVASECGLSNTNYTQLQQVYTRQKETGNFEILAFPCNQFAKNEPRCAMDVKHDMTNKFQATFVFMEKVNVNGPEADPLFLHLQTRLPGWPTNKLKWNFTKFLVVDGVPMKRYSPWTPPRKIEKDIVKAIAALPQQSLPQC